MINMRACVILTFILFMVMEGYSQTSLSQQSAFSPSVVYFDTGSYTIYQKKDENKLEISDDVLHRNDISFIITGYTDPSGNDTYNMNLSEKRANAVKKILLTKGVTNDRIIVKPLGETKSKSAAINDYSKWRKVEIKPILMKNEKEQP